MNEPISATIIPLPNLQMQNPLHAEGENFIESYLQYIGRTEAPQFYHRWCAISIIGAALAREFYFKRGHLELYPNLYLMLMGEPAARKSTAIKQAKKLLAGTGYSSFAGERTSKEKFLLDLAGTDTSNADPEDIVEQQLFGNLSNESQSSEMFIAADEFNDFTGLGNMEFISLLGSLWDFKGNYESRTKNSKSISIANPTISILAGNTATGFNSAFPQESIGQGFFSRLLLIYGRSTGKKIAFPDDIPEESTSKMQATLTEIRANVKGLAELEDDAAALLERIYNGWPAMKDIRFQSYSGRRFSHLIKLVLIITASRVSTTITCRDIIYANTILTHAEYIMPRALGEFGLSKHSATNHKIMQILDATSVPLSLTDIVSMIGADVDQANDVGAQLSLLQYGGKIQLVRGSSGDNGYLPKKEVITLIDDGTVDWNILTQEEKDYVLTK